MPACPWQPVDLLPHDPPMLLLDRVIAHDAEGAVAEADLGAGHPFAKPQGVPAHVGLELMAQACGVHTGTLARMGGSEVRLGFLLGTRNYQARQAWFPLGATLRIEARQVFAEDGMGVYDCRVLLDGEVVAQAQLSCFQPEDTGAVLGKMRGNDV